MRKKSAKEITVLANLKDRRKIKLLKKLNNVLFWIEFLFAIKPMHQMEELLKTSQLAKVKK